MDSPTSGLIVAYQSLSRPQLLLVRSTAGWGMPVGLGEENAAQLLARVKRVLFPANASVELMDGPRKSFAMADANVCFELAIAATDQLRDYVDTEEWFDVKWASLEEAFYIIQPAQENPLKWCQRGLKKKKFEE